MIENFQSNSWININ